MQKATGGSWHRRGFEFGFRSGFARRAVRVCLQSWPGHVWFGLYNIEMCSKITMSADDSMVLYVPRNENHQAVARVFLANKLIANQHICQFGHFDLLKPREFSCSIPYKYQQAAEATLIRGNVFLLN
ncbi:uncharacterized protein LOC129759282 [Uranotaenia lowii]|uniref:uncharacterized protein LOC129759282 n=1 Tax=Uranotaenia lowii TaxID=190385 RepID=UPI0024784B88|nr:uncharacterized protein LOC129759282 [Uranotaenia lowii]